MAESTIRAIDAHSVHRITSGQVVINLQTAVKELVENSLDAGSTSVEVRFQNYGLKTIEVLDNGSGIAPKDHDSIALKHYTSKLSSFEDLSRVLTFGFRGEALSSLCALADGFTVMTATSSESPMGTIIEMDRNGKVRSKCKVARQRGTTVTVSNLFKPLPVRRKELEKNSKREFGKALNLLHAYALVPCALENKGVRFMVSNQTEGGRKVIQFKTDGSTSMRASVLAVWGPKALENIVDLDLSFDVETEKSAMRRVDPEGGISVVTPVKIQGLISKFAVGAGRASVDRQFFFVNGRPYNPGKVQKVINEVYRTFNTNQSPFVIANVILPTNACDINVSPDKRTIFLHGENNLVQALRTALEAAFSSARSTYDVTTQPSQTQLVPQNTQQQKNQDKPQIHAPEHEEDRGEKSPQHTGTSPSSDKRTERNGRSSYPGLDDASGPSVGAEPIAMGTPHLLLGDELGGDGSEPEPEPTLVVQPPATGKTRGSGVQNGVGKVTDGLINLPRNRVPSEPLFFPESDEERNGAVLRADKGKAKEDGEPRQDGERHSRSLQLVRGETAATPTSSSTLTHAAQSPANILDKSHSVQTVLSTRDAAWNLRKDGDADGESERERKRAKVSGEHGRVRASKKSFRSSLSQFLGSGKKALPDQPEDESEYESQSGGYKDRGAQKGCNPSEEEDQLADDDEVEEETLSSRARGKRRRAGSVSSLVTMVVTSDDEHAMDVDEPLSTVAKPSRAGVSSIPKTAKYVAQNETEDLEAASEDEWAFSSTLVGNYVPPRSKAGESFPTSRPARPTEAGGDFVTLRVNLVSIGTHYLDIYNYLSSSSESTSTPPGQTPTSSLRSAVSSANLETGADDSVASAALSRIISKNDFECMVIVGQFNRGFIIMRKRCDITPGSDGGSMDDLFIVDQHAADEKWNFETLQENTVIASQKLFRPQQLQFTAADEMLAMENMDMLKRNGFELERMEDREVVGGEAGEGSEGVRVRLRLVAQPMSKDTVFDVKDLEELIHLMQDRPRGTMVRCSKARAMFAMRACRRSVMIGKALDKTQMTAIVRHMGAMDQPWNCPHGRPTMRHLSDLTSFGRYAPPRCEIDWKTYGLLGSSTEEA